MNDFNELIDIFFNHRKARTPDMEKMPTVKPKEKPPVTVDELIRRKSSLVLVDGILYRITCEPVDVEKLK